MRGSIPNPAKIGTPPVTTGYQPRPRTINTMAQSKTVMTAFDQGRAQVMSAQTRDELGRILPACVCSKTSYVVTTNPIRSAAGVMPAV